MSLRVALAVVAVTVLQAQDAQSSRLLPNFLSRMPEAAGFQANPGALRQAGPTPVRRSDAHMAGGWPFGSEPEPIRYDDRGIKEETESARSKRFMQSGRKLTEEELKRKSKIVDSANWPPRTMPIKGEGYFFFQGPSPKTAVQKDLPSFFSKENFEDLQIAPQQLAVTASGLGAAAVLAASLVAGDPATMLNLPAPTAVTAEKAAEQKAAAEKAAAAKAAKEAEAAKKAAEQKAAAEKAAAENAAKKAAAAKKAEEAAAQKAAKEAAAAEKAEKAAAEKAAAKEAAKAAAAGKKAEEAAAKKAAKEAAAAEKAEKAKEAALKR